MIMHETQQQLIAECCQTESVISLSYSQRQARYKLSGATVSRNIKQALRQRELGCMRQDLYVRDFLHAAKQTAVG